MVTPQSLAFVGIGQTLHLAIAESGYDGTFVLTGCAGIVTIDTDPSGTFALTSVQVGTCALTVTDTSSHANTIPVQVSTLSVPIQ